MDTTTATRLLDVTHDDDTPTLPTDLTERTLDDLLEAYDQSLDTRDDDE